MKHLKEEIVRFYCHTMARSWASGAKSSRDERWPGFEVFEATNGSLKLVDAYCGVEGSKLSSGFTIVWRKDDYQNWIPVLVISYAGWYEKRVIKFLMGVLRDAYRNGEFHGGRGQHHMTMDRDNLRLKYCNEIVDRDDRRFEGKERIFEYDLKETGEEIQNGSRYLGEHLISGMFLL